MKYTTEIHKLNWILDPVLKQKIDKESFLFIGPIIIKGAKHG